MIWGYHYFRKHPFAKNGRCHPIFHISDRKIHPKKVPTYSKDGLQFFSRLLATLGKKEHQAPPQKKNSWFWCLHPLSMYPPWKDHIFPSCLTLFESMIFRTSFPVGIRTHSHWVGYDSSPPQTAPPRRSAPSPPPSASEGTFSPPRAAVKVLAAHRHQLGRGKTLCNTRQHKPRGRPGDWSGVDWCHPKRMEKTPPQHDFSSWWRRLFECSWLQMICTGKMVNDINDCHILVALLQSWLRVAKRTSA